MHNLYKTSNTFFHCPQRSLRGHPLKNFKERSVSEVWKHFFTNRVVDRWNALSEDAVMSPTLNQFK
jgi:hypothetical protein